MYCAHEPSQHFHHLRQHGCRWRPFNLWLHRIYYQVWVKLHNILYHDHIILNLLSQKSLKHGRLSSRPQEERRTHKLPHPPSRTPTRNPKPRIRKRVWIRSRLQHQPQIYRKAFERAPRNLLRSTLSGLRATHSQACHGVRFSPSHHNGGPTLCFKATFGQAWWRVEVNNCKALTWDSTVYQGAPYDEILGASTRPQWAINRGRRLGVEYYSWGALTKSPRKWLMTSKLKSMEINFWQISFGNFPENYPLRS